MRLRRIITGAIAALSLGGLLAGPSTAQGAAPAEDAAAADFQSLFEITPMTVNGSYTPLLGNWCTEGDSFGFVIWYAPGPGADSLWSAPIGLSPEPPFSSQPMTINGTYTPILGDFDDNSCTDILWYAPGTAPDSIWYGDLGGGFTSKPLTLNGTYTPVVGRYFNPELGGCVSCDGIYWYSTNGGTESIWHGTTGRTFTSHAAPQVNANDYIVEPMGGGDILFYRPGTASDSMWTGVKAGDTAPASSVALKIDGTYEPHWVSYRGLLLYAPGTAPDRFVTYIGEDGSMDVENLTINGTYRVGVAPSMSNNPWILFHGPGAASDSLWYLPGLPD